MRTSQIAERTDYYLFGLTFNSFKRENSIEQRWKFQGQEHIDDLGLNWDSFKWRNHQPDIGRFFNIDPLASVTVSATIYITGAGASQDHADELNKASSTLYQSKRSR